MTLAALPDAATLPADARLYLRPGGLAAGEDGERLAGGPLTFDRVELIVWEAHKKPLRALATLPELEAWRAGLAAPQAQHVTELLQRLGAPRAWPPAGRPQVMGILNVTPDSFSDAGEHLLAEAAVAHGLRMVEEGADIVDVGGESTRPGARSVAEAEELRRVVPVVERLAAAGVFVSIDTRKAGVMRAATAAGARIINDVSALTHEPGSLEAAAASGARVVLMHMRGEPRSMNVAPHYDEAALEVFDWLAARIGACTVVGIPRERIAVDPGLCFGKREPHNLDILKSLALYQGLGRPVLLGVSRKGWAAWLQERFRPRERLPASLAAAQWGLERGVQILRVHDIAATRQMIDAWTTLATS